jgi:hypothetical protein
MAKSDSDDTTPPGDPQSPLILERRAAATKVAFDVTARLRSPDCIARAAAAAIAQTAFPESGSWAPYGLGGRRHGAGGHVWTARPLLV